MVFLKSAFSTAAVLVAAVQIASAQQRCPPNSSPEAVAIPALGAMLAVRNEIARVSDWPGGWSVFSRIAALALIPMLSWFGGQIAAQMMQSLMP